MNNFIGILLYASLNYRDACFGISYRPRPTRRFSNTISTPQSSPVAIVKLSSFGIYLCSNIFGRRRLNILKSTEEVGGNGVLWRKEERSRAEE